MNSQEEDRLLKIMAACRLDPLKFAQIAYPWGKDGLVESAGPRKWQSEILNEISNHLKNPSTRFTPLMMAVASGHGPGKSALVSIVVDWALSTRTDTKIVVSASTNTQLATKTFPEIIKWIRMSINAHWFNTTATSVSSRDPNHVRTWRADAIPWSAESVESFAGLHNKGRRIVLIFDEACHDDQTEVMTEKGWRFFKDLSGDERLLTMDQHGVAEYMLPESLHTSHRGGEMIGYDVRGASFLVTPNHRMLVESQNGISSMRNAGELSNLKNLEVKIPREFKWTATDLEKIEIPALVGTRRSWPAKFVDADDFIELMGWYCSEGHLSYSCGKYRVVGFTQKNTDHIASLCRKLGFKAKVYLDCSMPQVRIHCAQLAEFLSAFGVGCKNKGVPPFLRKASARQIDIFLNAYRDGDGYTKTKGRDIFYTSSKRMADELQELCFMAGQQSSVTMRALKGVENDFGTHIGISSCDGYIVSRSWTHAKLSLKTKNLKKIEYDGMVYCATLPKHGVLFTRRNGTCIWSGNSAIDDKIWEVAEGALTDENTEIIWLAFGNPTRNSGRFKECFGRFKHRWKTRQIDSRMVEGTNKEQLETYVRDYGEDSDFVRVRVKGEFPRAGTMQFIPGDIVSEARRREPSVHSTDPIVMGVDVGRFGDDQSVIVIRRGRDAVSIPWVKLRGADTMTLAARVMELAQQWQPDAIFVDEGGVGGGVVDRLRMLKQTVIGIQFGSKSDRSQEIGEGNIIYANKRAEMWGYMRDWLKGGSIPNDPDLESELCGVEYGYVALRGQDAIQLEKKSDMKKRGLASPDQADALALTFAYLVLPSAHQPAYKNQGNHQYDYKSISREKARGK